MKSRFPRCGCVCVIERQKDLVGLRCFPLLFHLPCALLSHQNWTQNEKNISHFLLRGAMRDESSIMCPSGCSAVRATFTHLQFRHFLLLITVFLPPFISSSFLILFLSCPLVSCPLFPLVILCIYERQAGPEAAPQTALCVCLRHFVSGLWSTG